MARYGERPRLMPTLVRLLRMGGTRTPVFSNLFHLPDGQIRFVRRPHKARPVVPIASRLKASSQDSQDSACVTRVCVCLRVPFKFVSKVKQETTAFSNPSPPVLTHTRLIFFWPRAPEGPSAISSERALGDCVERVPNGHSCSDVFLFKAKMRCTPAD